MKNNYTFAFFLITSFTYLASFAQLTYVPDDGFEQQLIDKGYDDFLDDYVLSANIRDVVEIKLSNYPNNVLNLIGLEDFRKLEKLTWKHSDYLIVETIDNLRLSNLPSLRELIIDGGIGRASLELLDISNSRSLEIIYMFGMGIGTLNTLDANVLSEIWIIESYIGNYDFKTNINLENFYSRETVFLNFDLTNNINLKSVQMEATYVGPDELIDLSNNVNLESASFYLQRGKINLKNGNNTNLTVRMAMSNNISCVQVDDPVYSNNNWFVEDCPNLYFSEDCFYDENDVDGDGVTDNMDTCPDTPDGETVDSNGCSTSQLIQIMMVLQMILTHVLILLMVRR